MLINIYEIVVGDIMHLEAGDVLPVDGVLLDGYISAATSLPRLEKATPSTRESVRSTNCG